MPVEAASRELCCSLVPDTFPRFFLESCSALHPRARVSYVEVVYTLNSTVALLLFLISPISSGGYRLLVLRQLRPPQQQHRS